MIYDYYIILTTLFQTDEAESDLVCQSIISSMLCIIHCVVLSKVVGRVVCAILLFQSIFVANTVGPLIECVVLVQSLYKYKYWPSMLQKCQDVTQKQSV